MTAHDQLLEGMRDLYARIGRLMNERLKTPGISLARLKLLVFIDRSSSARSIDICDEFGFAPRTVTEAIDALEREGLVQRDPHPTDRRAKQITVTAAGQAVLRAAAPYRQELATQVFEALAPEDEAELLRIVTLLNARVTELRALDKDES